MFLHFFLLAMTMGITMQSFVGIGNSVEFWRSAENPPPRWKILPPQQKIKNLPPSAKNLTPLAVILSPQQRYQVVFAWNRSITYFCIFILLSMSMGITMQSFVGIGHSMIFGIRRKILPLSGKSSPLSGKSSPLRSIYSKIPRKGALRSQLLPPLFLSPTI
jgi:hypothetical protein